MKQHTAYAVARFDGVLMYHSIKAGLTKTGITKTQIVFFKVKAGAQLHPVWVLDDLALEILVYCEAAKTANVSENHLQVSVTASWVSGENYSNLLANDVEWHIASSSFRAQAQRAFVTMKNEKDKYWPQDEIRLPVTRDP